VSSFLSSQPTPSVIVPFSSSHRPTARARSG
jgi:hypothetical protein